MTLIKKPDDVLPLLFSLIGIFIVYSFALYTPIRLSELNYEYILNITSLNDNFFKNFADIINRLIIMTTILYILFLYYSHLHNMTFVISTLLMAQSIFYMALQTDIIMLPNIDFFLLNLMGICLWHCFFLRQKSIFSLIQSCIILCLIMLVNPVCGVSLSIGLVVSTIVIQRTEKTDINYLSNIFVLLACGFCSFAFALVKNKIAPEFITLFQENCFYPLVTSAILSGIIILRYFNQKPFIQVLSYHSKSLATIYGILAFLGTSFIGRFDYMAHFT